MMKDRVIYTTPDSWVYGRFDGRMRKFGSMADLPFGGWSVADVVRIEMPPEPYPAAPMMPQAHAYPSLAEALAAEQSSNLIRQIFVANFKGAGYEIGAGSRPTCIPAEASVKYIDAFTFEEAADGSFVGQENIGFVPVDISSSADDLSQLPNGAADFFILCHVIEHVPSPLLALRRIYEKLSAGGQVFLVIPWGQFTFDKDRPLTPLYHLVADYLAPDHARDLEHYLEYFDLAAHNVNWLEKGQAAHTRRRDTHFHVFSPDSLRQLLTFATTLDPWSSFRVETPAAAEQLGEFYAVMTK